MSLEIPPQPRPSTVDPAAGRSVPPATPETATASVPRPADLLKPSLGKAAQVLTEAARGTGASQVLKSALEKMAVGLEQLLATQSGELVSPELQLLLEKTLKTGEEIGRTISNIKDHFTELKQLTEKRLEQIQKRIESKKASGFFSFIGKIFQAIATALTTVCSVVTANPAGMAAAALMIASLITSSTGLGQEAPWLQIGLGLGAAALSLGSAALPAAQMSSQAATAAKVVAKTGSAVAQTGSTAANVASGHHGAATLDAEAELATIKADSKRLLLQTQADRELTRELIAAMHRSSSQVLNMLGARHEAGMAPLALPLAS